MLQRIERIEIYPNQNGGITLRKNDDEPIELPAEYIALLDENYEPLTDEAHSSSDSFLLFDVRFAHLLPYVYNNDLPQVEAGKIMNMQGNTFIPLKAVLIDVFQGQNLLEMQSYNFYKLLFQHLIKKRLHAVYERNNEAD